MLSYATPRQARRARGGAAPATPTINSSVGNTLTLPDNATAAPLTTLSLSGGATGSWSITDNTGSNKLSLGSPTTGANSVAVNVPVSNGSPAAANAVQVQCTVDGSGAVVTWDGTVEFTDSGSDVLLETVTVDNFSGASRNTPYITFARNFEQGQVPSGTKVELRQGGSAVSLQQADGRAYFGDGSLKRAIFSMKSGTSSVSDAATDSAALYKTAGSFSNATSISRGTLTARSFRVRVKIGGTNYYCLLNNLDTAGTYREIRAGAAVRAWEHWGVLRAGTGGSDTDHGQLQAKFWSYVWSDGTFTVMARVINGRVANGQAYTVDEIELLDGATSITLHTTDFTFYAHSAVFLCDGAANPYWSAGLNLFCPRADPAYFLATSLGWRIVTNSTRNAAITVPTPGTYAPNFEGVISGGIDQPGGNAWIGQLPRWSAMANMVNSDTGITAANRKKFQAFDRTESLDQCAKHSAWMFRAESGLPPVLVNQDYTASGLTSAQPTIAWGDPAFATITDTGGKYDGAEANSSHGPGYAYHQWAVTGWEWWFDNLCSALVGSMGSNNPGTGIEYSRRPTINGVTYDCTCFTRDQERASAWLLRDLSNAEFTCPDNHPMKAYLGQLITNSKDVAAEMLTSPYASSAKIALGIIPTPYMIDPGDGHYFDIGQSNFQGSYGIIQYSLMVKRGHIDLSHPLIAKHTEKHLLGPHNACFFWSAKAYVFAHRAGYQPIETNAIIAPDYSDAYVDSSGGGTYLAVTTKLISDSGGVSGSCPASGIHGTWVAGHDYPNLIRSAANVANSVGIGNTSALLAKANAEYAAAGISDAAWAADQMQWDLSGT